MKLSDFLPSPTPLTMFMFFITGMLAIIVFSNGSDILPSLTPDIAMSVGGDTIKKVIEVLTGGEL